MKRQLTEVECSQFEERLRRQAYAQGLMFVGPTWSPNPDGGCSVNLGRPERRLVRGVLFPVIAQHLEEMWEGAYFHLRGYDIKKFSVGSLRVTPSLCARERQGRAPVFNAPGHVFGQECEGKLCVLCRTYELALSSPSPLVERLAKRLASSQRWEVV